MADLKIIHREWLIEVRLDEGEVPDLKRKYSSIVMHPYGVSIRFSQREDGEPGAIVAIVHGQRVNRAGLGVNTSESIYSYPEYPWVAELVDEAKALVLADLVDDGRG